VISSFRKKMRRGGGDAWDEARAYWKRASVHTRLPSSEESGAPGAPGGGASVTRGGDTSALVERLSRRAGLLPTPPATAR